MDVTIQNAARDAAYAAFGIEAPTDNAVTIRAMGGNAPSGDPKEIEQWTEQIHRVEPPLLKRMQQYWYEYGEALTKHQQVDQEYQQVAQEYRQATQERAQSVQAVNGNVAAARQYIQEGCKSYITAKDQLQQQHQQVDSPLHDFMNQYWGEEGDKLLVK